jgi:hypothetical protein
LVRRTTFFDDVSNLEIRYSQIDARVDNATWHDLNDLAAFNTDGFDVAGSNIWIHDCVIWNDDDCKSFLSPLVFYYPTEIFSRRVKVSPSKNKPVPASAPNAVKI